MLRTLRTLAFASILVSACTDARDGNLPSEPSVAVSGHASGLLLRVIPDANSEAASQGTSAFAVQAAKPTADSTSDVCDQSGSPPLTCGVQGGTPATGSVVVQCVSGPCTGSYQWSLLNPPPNTTTTFTPAITAVGEVSRYSIQTGNSTLPKVYDSQFLPAPVNGSPTPDPATIPVRVHVLCSYRLQSCPEAEIVDTLRANLVVSSPASAQTTVIGRAVRLRVRRKAGTGTGTYTLTGGSWNGQGSVVRNYDLQTGQVTPLTPADLQDTLLGVYWTTASASSGNVVQAAAMLLRDDGVRSQPRAKATFVAKAPTSVRLLAATQTVRVGVYDAPGNIALSLGTQISRPSSSGMVFTFTATAPSEDQGGLAAMTQLIRTQSQYTRNPNGDPNAPIFPSTNGAFWLDACPLYPGVGFANGTFVQADAHGKLKYQADDAPASLLTPNFNAVSRTDAFQAYFMYRPSGPESIWVPLGVLPWGWGGTATRTITNPDTQNLWTGPTGPSQSAGPSSLSASFPQWTTTLPGAQCSALPS
jgi:hypothetical protein